MVPHARDTRQWLTRRMAAHFDVEAWETEVAPLRHGLSILAGALPINIIPDVDSVAMTELAREKNFTFDSAGVGWGTDPVRRAHSLGSQLLGLAGDAATAMTLVATKASTVAFSIPILLRPVLEGSARAWRIHSANTLEERLAITYNEYLSDLRYLERSGLEDAARASTRRQHIIEAARRVGIPVTEGKNKQLEPIRESAGGVVEALMAPAVKNRGSGRCYTSTYRPSSTVSGLA